MKQPLYNFEIYQGADEQFPFAFYTDNNGDEVPVDLSSCSFIMTLRQALNKPIVDILTSDNGRIDIGTVTDNEFVITETRPNAIRLNFPHDVTTSFVFPSAVYDLFKIASNGTRELLLQGTVTVNKSVCYG